MQNTINQTIKSFNLGKLLSYKLLTNGFSNENYRIETEKGVFLYRVCKQQSVDELHDELRFLQILKKKSFPTAFPLQQADTTYIYRQNKYPVVIYNFIKGGIPVLNGETVKQVAIENAKLSLLKGSGLFLQKNTINMQAALRIFQQFPEAKHQYPDIFYDFTKAIDYLKDKLPDNLPKGIIHADIFPDNTIFMCGKLQAIIDFENFCVDDLLFDVAMTINGFCFVNNGLDLVLMDVFLAAYQSIRPLTPAEKKHLPDYILWAAVGMALWHLMHNMLHVKNDKQTERARELLSRYKTLKTMKLQIKR